MYVPSDIVKIAFASAFFTSFDRFQLGIFFVLNNYRFILKNQTDFRKTVESGMGPRSSSYINITKNKGNKI